MRVKGQTPRPQSYDDRRGAGAQRERYGARNCHDGLPALGAAATKAALEDSPAAERADKKHHALSCGALAIVNRTGDFRKSLIFSAAAILMRRHSRLSRADRCTLFANVVGRPLSVALDGSSAYWLALP